MKRNLSILAIPLVIILLLASCSSGSSSPTATPSSGTIVVKGSDTMVNLASAWAEAYRSKNPGVQITVSGGGSGIGIASLIDGTTDICDNSRPWKQEEIDKAKTKGVNPVETKVALDGVAVVVNPQNRIGELTLEQLAAIFTGNITNWKELGAADAPIVVLSRDSNSGTHVFFKEHVLQAKDKKAEYGKQVQFLPTSQAIADEVARNPNALGYYGMGYLSLEQKEIAIKKDSGSPAVKPSAGTVKDGTYPIARPLFCTTNGQPSGLIAEYLKWILGPDGQRIVGELEFVTIP
jgi:phosphate transport system substrate-binding protein